jgi:hypothetical protein
LQDVERRPDIVAIGGRPCRFAAIRRRSVSSMMKVHLLLNFLRVVPHDVRRDLAGRILLRLRGRMGERSVKREFRSFQKTRRRLISTSLLATVVMAMGTLTWGCSAEGQSNGATMAATGPGVLDAANWRDDSYNGWSSFYSPAITVNTRPRVSRKSSAHRLTDRLEDNQCVRSGHTDSRWVRVKDSESEQFTERQQVLETPQIFYSDDAEPAFAGTNRQYDLIGSDDGIRDDLKAARFIP